MQRIQPETNSRDTDHSIFYHEHCQQTTQDLLLEERLDRSRATFDVTFTCYGRVLGSNLLRFPAAWPAHQ